MKNMIVKYVYQNFAVELIVNGIRSVTSNLGPDGAKTIIGLIVAALGMAAKAFPDLDMWFSPLLKAFEPFAGEVATGGVSLGILGLFDKLLKMLKGKIEDHKDPSASS